MTSSAQVYKALQAAKRPVLVYGWGVRLAGAVELAERLAFNSQIPVALTWGAADMCWQPELYRIGTFGTHGVRYANFAIQNADVILSVGSRLDTKATGSPASTFAPKARVFMVDIDAAEIGKFDKAGRKIEGICENASKFLRDLLNQDQVWPSYAAWREQIGRWKRDYPICPPEYEKEKGVNPYVFVRALSDELLPDDVIVSDTGCALGWMMQGFHFKGQRFIHAFNNTPMGYGLSAAVGAAFATGKRIVLVTGDGGFSVNIGELGTIQRHNLPIKIFLFNNKGHAMCRQTQRQWLGGEYPSTSYEGGLATPDFREIAKAYGFRTYGVLSAKGITLAIQGTLWGTDPCLLDIAIDPDQGIVPQVKFGAKLEDGEPLLPREELAAIMTT